MWYKCTIYVMSVLFSSLPLPPDSFSSLLFPKSVSPNTCKTKRILKSLITTTYWRYIPALDWSPSSAQLLLTANTLLVHFCVRSLINLCYCSLTTLNKSVFPDRLTHYIKVYLTLKMKRKKSEKMIRLLMWKHMSSTQVHIGVIAKV